MGPLIYVRSRPCKFHRWQPNRGRRAVIVPSGQYRDSFERKKNGPSVVRLPLPGPLQTVAPFAHPATPATDRTPSKYNPTHLRLFPSQQKGARRGTENRGLLLCILCKYRSLERRGPRLPSFRLCSTRTVVSQEEEACELLPRLLRPCGLVGMSAVVDPMPSLDRRWLLRAMLVGGSAFAESVISGNRRRSSSEALIFR